jgi:hypothetical protein
MMKRKDILKQRNRIIVKIMNLVHIRFIWRKSKSKLTKIIFMKIKEEYCMNRELQNGDVLIIGGEPYMIIDYWERQENGTRGDYKHCLLHLGGFFTDCLFKKPDFKIGETVFGDSNDEFDMKVEMIIPKEKVKIYFEIN